MNNKVLKSGYSLIEAVIAVSILAIVISTSLSIILTSTETEEANQDFLIGNMLAVEGAERVKNIYYTNILKFGAENIYDCGFVHTIDTSDVSNCQANQILDDTNFLQLTGDLKNFDMWDLVSTSESMVVDGALNDAFALYSVEVPSNIADSESINIYVPYEDGDKTEFHREIIVNTGVENIEIVSRIGWIREDGKIRTLEANVTLPRSL
jgi:type II secretory pathway pseudopilin PulG